MKKLLLFCMGVFTLLLVSCTQDADEDMKDGSSLVETQYLEFKTLVQTELSDKAMALGMTQTKADNESSIMDILLQISPEKLSCSMSSYDSSVGREQFEMKQDSIFEEFFSIYSDADYMAFNKALEDYISEGGHNPLLVTELSKDMSSNLVIGFVYMCSYADVLVSKDLWNWLNNSIRYDSFETRAPSLELSCREALLNKLRLISISAGCEYMSSMVTGPAMPDVDALITFANLMGAAGEVIDYYACCRGGIR